MAIDGFSLSKLGKHADHTREEEEGVHSAVHRPSSSSPRVSSFHRVLTSRLCHSQSPKSIKRSTRGAGHRLSYFFFSVLDHHRIRWPCPDSPSLYSPHPLPPSFSLLAGSYNITSELGCVFSDPPHLSPLSNAKRKAHQIRLAHKRPRFTPYPDSGSCSCSSPDTSTPLFPPSPSKGELTTSEAAFCA